MGATPSTALQAVLSYRRSLGQVLVVNVGYNEGEYGAHSTMTSIFGRMATYSGKKLTWDEAFNSTLDLSPAKYDFSADPPVMPNSDGFYPVAVPGKTELSQIV